MVWDWEHSQSKSRQGELYGSSGQWCTDQHYHSSVCWNSLPGCWASLGPHRQVSYLCRPGKHPHLTYWLHHHMRSSRWSQGLQWGSVSPHSPDLSNFTAQVPMMLGTPTIGHIVNVIKESEIDTLAMPWVNTIVAYLLAVRQVMPC